MNKRIITKQEESRPLLLEGVKLIADMVETTLGPSGKHIFIRQENSEEPFVTKDGVTVASTAWHENPVAMMAIEIMQNVSKYSDSKAGDGTTTAMVLARAFFEAGIVDIADNNYRPFDYVKGMRVALEHLKEIIKESSVECKSDEMIKQVASISLNNDPELAEVILESFKISGQQGIVRLLRSKTGKTYLTQSDGMTYPIGYLTPYFANNGLGQSELNKPVVFMTNERIINFSDGLKMILKECNETDTPLLIMCDDMDDRIVNKLIQNQRQGAIQICVTKLPGFGEQAKLILKETAMRLGGVAFLDDSELTLDKLAKEIEAAHISYSENEALPKPRTMLSYLGVCDEVMCDEHTLSLKGGGRPEQQESIQVAIDSHLVKLRKEANEERDQYSQSELQTRISRLADGIAFIHIGGYSDIEFTETQHRITDALHAVKAASDEGVVIGGGMCLYRASMSSKVEWKEGVVGINAHKAGANMVLNNITEPFKTILSNADLEDEKMINQLHKVMDKDENVGIDALEGKIVDMFKSGILDPTKVTRVALENAVSIASMLLTLSYTVVEPKSYQPQQKTPMY